MKELIDPHQAHLLMLGVLVFAPIAGVIWGYSVKRLVFGLVVGLLAGGGNYALWTLYNAVTSKLGLDTVANLLVNLGLFIVIGIAVGVIAGIYAPRKQRHQGGDNGNMAGDRPG